MSKAAMAMEVLKRAVSTDGKVTGDQALILAIIERAMLDAYTNVKCHTYDVATAEHYFECEGFDLHCGLLGIDPEYARRIVDVVKQGRAKSPKRRPKMPALRAWVERQEGVFTTSDMRVAVGYHKNHMDKVARHLVQYGLIEKVGEEYDAEAHVTRNVYRRA